ncbi:MAG: hypothetical protein KF819_35995 [Labilithrix sp.]|nr:hypothetical protein [Labilithrix sp.]
MRRFLACTWAVGTLAACLGAPLEEIPGDDTVNDGGRRDRSAPDDDIGMTDATADASERDAGARWDAQPPPPPPWVDPGFPCHFADAGTSPSTPVAPSTASGTRIKPRYVVLEDGTKFLYELYDEGLDAVCDITTAHDGVVRCVPAMATSQVAWADPTCTKRAASAPASCPPTRFVDTGVYRELTAAESYYSPTCTPATPTFTGDFFSFELSAGGIVPSSSFVAFTDERVKVTPEIDVIMKVGDDGSRVFLNEFYDDEHAVRAEISGDRLLPVPNVTPSCCGEAGDPISCGGGTTAPSAESGCPVFTMSSSAPLGRVPNSAKVFRPGRPVASLTCPTFSYTPKNGYCSKIARSPTGISRALEVSSSCFAPVVAHPSTTGRLRPAGRSMPVAVEGVLAAPPLRRLSWPPYAQSGGLELLDTLTGKPCVVVRMSDDKHRCANFTASLVKRGMHFTDSTCTTPAALRGSGGRPMAQIDDVTEACPRRGAVRIFDPEPTPTPTAQSYTLAADGTCIPASGTWTLHAGAAIEIPPREFPEVEIWTAP